MFVFVVELPLPKIPVYVPLLFVVLGTGVTELLVAFEVAVVMLAVVFLAAVVLTDAPLRVMVMFDELFTEVVFELYEEFEEV